MKTASITDLLRNPKGVLRRVDQSQEVVIERRDAAPLRLALSSQVDEERRGTAVLARLLARALPGLGKTLWAPVEELHPWLRFLPAAERETFLRELAETIEACSALGNNAPLGQLLHEWKATAAVYADPKLLAVLKGPSRGTSAKVLRPKAEHR